jgi:putative PIN family toxin of toxin-antitoxin system
MTENGMRWRIVLDTNLLVSGFISHTGPPHALIQRWYDRAFVIVVSPQLQREYEDVLSRPRLITHHGLSREQVEAFFIALSQDGVLVEPSSAVTIEVRDKKDERVLAAAIGGNADYLVTGDNDLLTLAGDARLGDLKIVTARAFLDLL